ncbi:MAG: TetR/AcrR family transcriptional regulator [Sphingomonadales bacterium]|nr:TetR/AcrR family transcriptional regulator [Sphingomonadales bacterium]MDE2170491.1 TetR/AcrR family transcriptional regulator [Sphingomonadales bacterium]
MPNQADRDKGEQRSKPSRPHSYKESAKRRQTKQENKRTIEQAAWDIFSRKGFDASTNRDIISSSGVSPGTFYSYYGSKEAIFRDVLASLVEKIRVASHDARMREGSIEDRLRISFRVFLELIASLPQGRSFCERNQHHIRDILYREGIIGGIISDMRDDYKTEIITGMPPEEEMLIVRLIFAVGLEAALLLSSNEELDARRVSDLSSKFALFGLNFWATK